MGGKCSRNRETTYRTLVAKYRSNISLGDVRHTWEDNIKMEVTCAGCKIYTLRACKLSLKILLVSKNTSLKACIIFALSVNRQHANNASWKCMCPTPYCRRFPVPKHLTDTIRHRNEPLESHHFLCQQGALFYSQFIPVINPYPTNVENVMSSK